VVRVLVRYFWGPVLSGLAKPVQVLAIGASANDIVAAAVSFTPFRPRECTDYAGNAYGQYRCRIAGMFGGWYGGTWYFWGPVLSGLAKPVQVLAIGASPNGIRNAAAFAAVGV
jgi:phosphotransacetylase